jgi:hypothetical protein
MRFSYSRDGRVESPSVQAALQLIAAFDQFADGRASWICGAWMFPRRAWSWRRRGRAAKSLSASDNFEQQLRRWRQIYDFGQQPNSGRYRIGGSGGGEQRARALDAGQCRAGERDAQGG